MSTPLIEIAIKNAHANPVDHIITGVPAVKVVFSKVVIKFIVFISYRGLRPGSGLPDGFDIIGFIFLYFSQKPMNSAILNVG